MSLRIWLPLDGDLKNQGLDNGVPTNTGATINNSGKIGKCYEFNGSSRITVPLVNLSTFSTTNCSMCVWVKFPTLSSSNKQILNIGTSSGWGNIRFGILYKYSAAQVVTSISDGSSYVAYNCYANITENAWSHVAAVYSNRELKLYINGNLASTYATTYDISFTNVTSLGIGAAPNGNEAFTGCLNDVRIYDHALSAREIKEISKGLILHYPLNRGGFGQDNYLQHTATMPVHTSSFKGFRASGGTVSHIDYSDCPVGTGVIRVTNTGSAAANVGMAQDSISGFVTGQRYSQSCYVRCSTTVSTCYLQPIWISSSQHTEAMAERFTIGTDWQYIKFEGAILNGDQATSYSSGYIYANIPAGAWFEVCGMKVEEGSVATPWIPNPADVEYAALGLGNNIEYDCSGFGNNGEWYHYDSVGTVEYTSNTPRYRAATYINSESNTTNTASGTVFLYGHCGLTNPTVMSVAFWLKPVAGYNSSTGQGQFCTTNNPFVASGATSAGNDYRDSAMNHRDSAVDINATGGTTQARPAFLPTANEWHHYVVTYDGQTGRVYTDGVQTSSAAFSSATVLDSFIGVVIGYSQAGGAWRSNKSYYSDFRVYATCLSADDILTLYNTPVSIANNGVMMVQGELSEV